MKNPYYVYVPETHNETQYDEPIYICDRREPATAPYADKKNAVVTVLNRDVKLAEIICIFMNEQGYMNNDKTVGNSKRG